VVVAPQGDPRNPFPLGNKEGWLPWVDLSRRRPLINVLLVMEQEILQRIGLTTPAEAQGKPMQKPSSGRSSVTSANRLQGSDTADLKSQSEDKITRLCEELRVAELELSLTDGIPTTNVLHGSQSADLNEGEREHEGPVQGPIVEADVC